MLKLKRTEIAEIRETILKAMKIAQEAESMLEDAYTPGRQSYRDDPLSNVIAAVECLREAFDCVNADSEFIEIV